MKRQHPMSILLRKTALGLAIGLALLTTSCSSIRGTFRSLNNTNMVGKMTPGILDGKSVPASLEQSSPGVGPKWTLLSFFLPT